MFNVFKDEIKELNDTDLKILVGLLCEAELNSIGNKTSDVMYGGNQDEPDDGIDVLVNATKINDNDKYILNNNTIFQVKKPSMPASKIKNEMMDSTNTIRKCISNLNEIGGAYIIVSSGDDLTPPRYQQRIDAMKNLLSNGNLNNVIIDFYDCGRIATWVNNYPAIICWVKDKVGIFTNGWVTYCNWSSRTEDEKEFLYDENTIVYRNDFSKDNRIGIVDSINEMRELLSTEKNSIRLAGLSGVGKTRFAQTLFDSKIGKKPLNKETVIYGDISDNLTPDPVVFIQQLQKLNKRVILIVDNCEPNMHNELTKICQYNNSLISLLTIEYEVKEDDNVDSNNYYLASTSSEILKKMLKRDYKDISDINVDTITKCSDGNFRIAIYLSKAIQKEKNIGVLNYNDLIYRLFYQGKNIDEELLKIGEVCSIFYSFNGKYDIENENSELDVISKLTGIDSLTIYRRVSDLIKRQIVQKRGDMRAILPHALANKLAIDFFKKYPIENLMKVVAKNDRLSLSFFRRIKFLHTSNEAQKIGKLFILSIDNYKLLNIDKNTLEKIRCISIINPLLILEKIESIDENKFFSRENINFIDWINILCIIAYNAELFQRVISLIIRFALTEKENENYNSIKHMLNGFFHIYLSNTLAPVELRLKIVDELIKSSDEEKFTIGFKLLEEMLSIGPFTGAVISDCGSQLRDYGIEPNYRDWYLPIIEYCNNNLKNDQLYEKFKSIIINNFKNLSRIGFYNKLEEIVMNNIDKGSWKELWISLLSIKHFDSDKISESLMERINNLIGKLRPTSLEDKVRIYLGTNKRIYFDLDEITDDYESVDNLIINLGKELGLCDDKLFDYLALLNNRNNSKIHLLASGIMETYNDYNKLIYNTLSLYKDENCNVIKILVSGFMSVYHSKSIEYSSNFLDEITENKKYSKFYLTLQLSYFLDENDIVRIKKHLSCNNYNKEEIYKLQFYISKLTEEAFLDLINSLNESDYEIELIVVLLFRYIENNEVSNNFKAISRKYITKIDFSLMKKNNNTLFNYEVSELIKVIFNSNEGIDDAKNIFAIINNLIKDKYISFYDLEDLLIPLIKIYPKSFLDIFVNYIGKPSDFKRKFIRGFYNNKNVLANIDDFQIIEWLQETNKNEEISYIAEPIYYDSEKECYYWTDLGKFLINKYYNNEIIINNILKSVFPSSWSNEYSTVLKKRVNLYNELRNSQNPFISKIGEKNLKEIEGNIQYCLKKEAEENEERFNTFE